MPRIATSSSLAETVSRETGRECLAIIPNGLDPVFVETVPHREFDPSRPARVGVLYRRQDWKRMDDALAVLSRCAANNPFQPVLFGEPINARHRAALTSFDNAEYHPRPSGRGLRDIYRSLDVFLFTSDETEAFGNPPFEAMASGVATVSTRVGAAADLLTNEVDALLCEPRDVERMAACVTNLIENTDRRRELAAAGAQTAGRLDWGQAAKTFETVLREILEGNAGQIRE